MIIDDNKREQIILSFKAETSKRRQFKSLFQYSTLLGFVKDTQILRVSFQVIKSDRRKIVAILLNAPTDTAAEKYQRHFLLRVERKWGRTKSNYLCYLSRVMESSNGNDQPQGNNKKVYFKNSLVEKIYSLFSLILLYLINQNQFGNILQKYSKRKKTKKNSFIMLKRFHVDLFLSSCQVVEELLSSPGLSQPTHMLEAREIMTNVLSLV